MGEMRMSSFGRAAAAAALFFGLCAYTAPNHQFQVDMGVTAASWTVDKEIATDDNTFVLFRFAPSIPAGGATGERTIMWHKMADLVANTDTFALGLATGFLGDRYPQGHFEITTKARSRTADGQPYYVFTATGLYKDIPAQWTGVVVYYPSQGAALAADLHSLKGQDTRNQLGISDAEVIAWGTSLKPGE
jgi:hypothetical protein